MPYTPPPTLNLDYPRPPCFSISLGSLCPAQVTLAARIALTEQPRERKSLRTLALGGTQ